jgi:hypothetical protein
VEDGNVVKAPERAGMEKHRSKAAAGQAQPNAVFKVGSCSAAVVGRIGEILKLW